jgi:hypothetical protein
MKMTTQTYQQLIIGKYLRFIFSKKELLGILKKKMEALDKFCPEIVTLLISWISGEIISFK